MVDKAGKPELDLSFHCQLRVFIHGTIARRHQPANVPTSFQTNHLLQTRNQFKSRRSGPMERIKLRRLNLPYQSATAGQHEPDKAAPPGNMKG